MTKTAKPAIAFAAVAAVLGFAALAAATPACAEPTGSTCSDCAIYKAKYSIENNTGITFNYQFRWGDDQPWQVAEVFSGQRKTHTYPLGANPQAGAPTPSIRFLGHLCGKAPCMPWTWTTRVMHFHAVVVDPGYVAGTPTHVRKPERFKVVVTGGDFGQYILDVIRK